MHGCLIENRFRTNFCLSQKNFCPLGKREVNSIVGVVVVTSNVYTIHVIDIPHHALVQILFLHKQQFYLLGNREVQRLLGWLL